jgi:hypothetical protein
MVFKEQRMAKTINLIYNGLINALLEYYSIDLICEDCYNNSMGHKI